MNKRFLIKGVVFKLEGSMENEKNAVEKLQFASTVLNANLQSFESNFQFHERNSLEHIIETYNNILEKEDMVLSPVGDNDDIIIKL